MLTSGPLPFRSHRLGRVSTSIRIVVIALEISGGPSRQLCVTRRVLPSLMLARKMVGSGRSPPGTALTHRSSRWRESATGQRRGAPRRASRSRSNPQDWASWRSLDQPQAPLDLTDDVQISVVSSWVAPRLEAHICLPNQRIRVACETTHPLSVVGHRPPVGTPPVRISRSVRRPREAF